jgi:pantoate--beta-alanine ligase
MTVIESIAGMQRTADGIRSEGLRIGFVPTMGALHDGHLDLIRRASSLCDRVVVSVFVNPSQFGKNEDLSRYPRDLSRDMELASGAGCDIMFVPTAADMYPEGAVTWVQVEGLGAVLEGSFRPTHFRGVTTVVMSLFNIVKPHFSIFGQKDAQQAVVIRRMVKDLHVDTDIVVAPTLREADGLAMSSRNMYLSKMERSEALAISRSLRLADSAFLAGERSAPILRGIVENELRSSSAIGIDYVALVDAETLEAVESVNAHPALLAVAVRIGTTRLIDNTILE